MRRHGLDWPDAYTMLDFYGFSRPEGRAPRGKQPAKRAVELDPGLGEAHSALACVCVYLMSDSDLAEAEKEFLCAPELNPRYIQARAWYALFYLQLARGRLEEGISQAKLAMESDPLSGYAHAMLGMTYSLAGRYAEALQTLQRGVELEPESFLPRWSMHWTLHLSGRFAEAVAAGEEVLASSGRHAGQASSRRSHPYTSASADLPLHAPWRSVRQQSFSQPPRSQKVYHPRA